MFAPRTLRRPPLFLIPIFTIFAERTATKVYRPERGYVLSHSNQLNPYAVSEVSIENSPPTRAEDASLIWFAVPCVLVLWAVWIYLYSSIPTFSFFELLIESLRRASPPVVTLIIVLALVRFLVRKRFDCRSTASSLFVGGLLASALATTDILSRTQFRVQVSMLVEIPLIGVFSGVAIYAGERWIVGRWLAARSSDEFPGEGVIPARRQSAHASVFWFSAFGCVMAVFLGITSVVSQIEADGVTFHHVKEWFENLTFSMVAPTFSYVVLSSCVPRKSPATIASRVSAATVWFAVMISALMFAQPRSLTMLLVVFFLVAPALAVCVDRWVSRRHARILTELSQTE